MTRCKMGCKISINLKERLSPKPKRKSSDSATSPIVNLMPKVIDETVVVNLDEDDEYI